MNSQQQAEATAQSSREWAVGSPSVGPVLDPHPCHAGQAVDRQGGVGRGWIRSSLWTRYVLRFGAGGVRQHGPYNNCEHEASTDTGMETCQWPKVQKIDDARFNGLQSDRRCPRTRPVSFLPATPHATWDIDVRPGRNMKGRGSL